MRIQPSIVFVFQLVTLSIHVAGTLISSLDASSTRSADANVNSNDTCIGADSNHREDTDSSVVRKQEKTQVFKQDSCNLYLAPSTIPNAGFGVYTTQDILYEAPVNRYRDSPLIAILDQTNPELSVHRNYVWDHILFTKFEADVVAVNLPSWSGLCNHHSYFHNIMHGDGDYDDSMASRWNDPSAGSFSYHSGVDYKASRDILAGEELFFDYGDAWLDLRPGTYADVIPRHDEFDTGRKIVHKLLHHRKRMGSNFYNEDTFMTQRTAMIKFQNERVQSLIPRTLEELEVMDNLTWYPTDLEPLTAKLALSKLRYQQNNVSWIQKHGVCLENVEGKTSSIPMAGRGAFATRFLPKGSIISPSPLVQIMNRDDLVISRNTNKKTVASTQLLINYCFGHRSSRILLCPQSTLALMNHCSSRGSQPVGQCDNIDGPNAVVQWATDWSPMTSTWLNKTLQELDDISQEGKAGLAFEVVAVRDILPGDEIFIDYGQGWEDAWVNHVQSWFPSPRDSDSSYIPLVSFLSNSKNKLRTVAELKSQPYPENILQVCLFDLETAELYGQSSSEDDDVSVSYEDSYEYDMSIENGEIFQSQRPSMKEEESHNLFPCDILNRNDDDATLTVVVLPAYDDEDLVVLIKNFPIGSVTYRMTPYSSDQHLYSAFRHYIEIPNEIFPSHWMESTG